jgi:hypothetical protein
MGGAIYANVFASRAHFLDYTREFETRLAAAKALKPGPGVLVFCGTGFAWHQSNLARRFRRFLSYRRPSRRRCVRAYGTTRHQGAKDRTHPQHRSFCVSAPPHGEAAEGRVSFSRSRPAPRPSAAQTTGARSAVAAVRSLRGTLRGLDCVGGHLEILDPPMRRAVQRS